MVSADSIDLKKAPVRCAARPLKFAGQMHKGQSYKDGRTGDKRRFHTCWLRAIEKSLKEIRQQMLEKKRRVID